jgi:hypothetical protein
MGSASGAVSLVTNRQTEGFVISDSETDAMDGLFSQPLSTDAGPGGIGSVAAESA